MPGPSVRYRPTNPTRWSFWASYSIWFDLNGRTAATMAISIANPVGGAVAPTDFFTFSIRSTVDFRASHRLNGCFAVGSPDRRRPSYASNIFGLNQVSIPGRSHQSDARQRNHTGVSHGTSRTDRLWCPPFHFRYTGGFIQLIRTSFRANYGSGRLLEPRGWPNGRHTIAVWNRGRSGDCAAVRSGLHFPPGPHHEDSSPDCCWWMVLLDLGRPHNTPALFVIIAAIGMSSLTLLPVALELGCEVTRNAQGSSALLWFIVNLFEIAFVQGQGALRAGANASPPLNMHRALI
ncbi:hypothetical protein B0H12DRAFT_353512 [Mycena haematopus]|nr:hypothetical protein B0H12DRAFT_353512 [Mycena haematopus]